MTTLSSSQRDQIDKAVRELDPLSQAQRPERSEDEYSDGVPSPERIKEAFVMLSEAVRLIAVEAKTGPSHPNIEKALELAEKAQEHIHTGTVTRD